VLEAMVEVGAEYPIRPPRFKLKLEGGRGRRTTLPAAVVSAADPYALQVAAKTLPFDNCLKVIEAEINTCTDEAEENMILSIQLKKLQQCFNELMESRKGDAVKSKSVQRKRVGRDRRISFLSLQ